MVLVGLVTEIWSFQDADLLLLWLLAISFASIGIYNSAARSSLVGKGPTVRARVPGLIIGMRRRIAGITHHDILQSYNDFNS